MRPWVLIIPLVLFDLLTKTLAKGKHLELFRYFSITYTENKGIIFGLFNQNNILWIVITTFFIGIILYFYQREKNYRLSLSFLLAGALGNLIDRVAYGFVIDFLDFKIWPVFNFADMYLVIGVLLTLLLHAKKTKTF